VNWEADVFPKNLGSLGIFGAIPSSRCLTRCFTGKPVTSTEVALHPLNSETHEGGGREEVRFGFADLAPMAHSGFERGPSDDLERVNA
jgi:hypothetical protein